MYPLSIMLENPSYKLQIMLFEFWHSLDNFLYTKVNLWFLSVLIFYTVLIVLRSTLFAQSTQLRKKQICVFIELYVQLLLSLVGKSSFKEEIFTCIIREDQEVLPHRINKNLHFFLFLKKKKEKKLSHCHGRFEKISKVATCYILQRCLRTILCIFCHFFWGIFYNVISKNTEFVLYTVAHTVNASHANTKVYFNGVRWSSGSASECRSRSPWFESYTA